MDEGRPSRFVVGGVQYRSGASRGRSTPSMLNRQTMAIPTPENRALPPPIRPRFVGDDGAAERRIQLATPRLNLPSHVSTRIKEEEKRVCSGAELALHARAMAEALRTPPVVPSAFAWTRTTPIVTEAQRKAYADFTPSAPSHVPIVPKSVEELYMSPHAVFDSRRCVNGAKRCEAARLCRERSVTPFVLPAFAPKGTALEREQRCVLCIRRFVMEALTACRFEFKTLDARCIPYRNAVGFDGDHPVELCLQFTPEEREAGCTMFFVAHDPGIYNVTGDAIYHVW